LLFDALTISFAHDANAIDATECLTWSSRKTTVTDEKRSDARSIKDEGGSFVSELNMKLLPRETSGRRKLNPGILVMQPAQDWATKYVPGAIDIARDWRILLMEYMRAFMYNCIR
jgi:hypothetical protein